MTTNRLTESLVPQVAAKLRLVRRRGFAFRMEPCFWEGLKEICTIERTTSEAFIAQAGKDHPGMRIGRAVRLQILKYVYRNYTDSIQVIHAENAMLFNEIAGMTPCMGLAPDASPLPDDKIRILLVDDDPDVLAVLTACLLAEDFEVVAARSAEIALRHLADHRDFSIVVSDFAMVGLNGVQLVNQIRECCPGIPALIISGYMTSAMHEARLAGDECLEKPFRQRDLVQKIRVMIGRDRRAKAAGLMAAYSPMKETA